MIEKLSTSLLLPAELADTSIRYRKVLLDEQVIVEKGADTQPREPYIQKISNLIDDDQTRLNTALTAVRQTS